MSDQESTPQEGQEPAPATEPKAEGQNPAPEAPKGTEGKTFSEDYVKSLREEAARNRVEAQEAKAKVQEFEDRDKSEVERLQTKLAKAEKDSKERERKLLAHEIAAEKGLDPKVAAVLSGSTREELEAAADVVLNAGKKEEPKPEFDGGAREPAPAAKSPEEAHNELLTTLFGGGQTQN